MAWDLPLAGSSTAVIDRWVTESMASVRGVLGGGGIHVFMPIFCQFTNSCRIFRRLTSNFSSVHTFTSFFRPNVFKARLKHGFCPKFRTFFIDIYSRPLCSLNNKNSSSPNSLRRMKTGELEKNWLTGTYYINRNVRQYH